MSIYSVTTEGEEALAAATRETLVQLRGSANTKAKIVAWGVSFDGVDPVAAPVLVELERQSTDGTATAATEVPLDTDDPAALLTGFHSFTAQPTQGNILEQYEIHPAGGLFVREYPPGREPVVDSDTASRIGLSVTAAAVVNAVAWIQWEE